MLLLKILLGMLLSVIPVLLLVSLVARPSSMESLILAPIIAGLVFYVVFATEPNRVPRR